MDPRNSLPASDVTFGGLVKSSCQNDTTEPKPYYQGMSVQTLEPPCSAYFSQSNADQNNSHPVNSLDEFSVEPLIQAVSDGSDELELTVIPQSFLDEHAPWHSGDESIDDELLTTLSSYLYNDSYFSWNELDIRETAPADPLNPDHHLTDLPTELANPQNLRLIAVINPLNLQQATSDNPVNPAEIVDDKSSPVEQQKWRQKERQRERRREREREYRKNPAFIELEKERKKRYRKNPAFIERERERKRGYRKDPIRGKNMREKRRRRLNERYRNDPVYAECQRVYSRTYFRMRKKFDKKEASRLAKVARNQYLQSVKSPGYSGCLPAHPNKSSDVLSSQTD